MILKVPMKKAKVSLMQFRPFLLNLPANKWLCLIELISAQR